jgi:hypothetical protein
MLELLGNDDANLKFLVENKGVFHGLSPEIQNDITASVSECMVREIKGEVSEPAFVSLIVDEATDISMKSQVSSVLRYVSKNGDEEIFLHFTDLSRDRTANALFQHAKQVLCDFNCASKLVAQTHDGAAVMACEHMGLQAKLSEHCKDATFLPLLCALLKLGPVAVCEVYQAI